MKNLIVRAALLTGLAARAYAGTYSDNFPILNPAYWTVSQSTPGLYSVSSITNGLALAKTGPSPGGLQYVQISLNLAALGGSISGDFSTQINFTNAVIGPNNDQVQLNATFSGDSPFDGVYDLSSGRNVHVWNGSINNPITETVTYGTFTISRTGSTVTGYFNGTAIFSETESAALTNISFNLQNQVGSDDYPSVTFNNFSLTAASVPGTNYLWNGSVSLDWFNPTNWTPVGVPGSNDTVNFANGQINLSSPVTMNRSFNWSGGTLSGDAMTIGSTGVMSITGNVGLKSILTNAGTVTMTGTAYVTVYNNDTPSYDGGIYNLAGALWDIQTNASIYDAGYGYEFFNNAGALLKSGGVATSYIGVPFTNAGTVTNLSGTLNFDGGGVPAGVYDTVAGATIDFASGSFSMGVPPIISGAGLCEFTGTTLTLLSEVPPDLVLAGGSLDLGPAFQNNGVITNLTLAGSVLGGTNTVLGTLTCGGGFSGPLLVEAGASMTWTGGTASGPLSIESGGVVSITGNVGLKSILTNAGTVTMTGTAYMTVYNNDTPDYDGGVYNLAGALWDIQTNANIYDAGYGYEFFNNAGALLKSGGVATSYIGVPFTNAGTVTNLSGTLNFDGGGVLAGAYDTVAGATIDFAEGSFSIGVPPVISGAGLCEFTGTTLTLAENVPPNLVLAGGSLDLGPAFQSSGGITNLTLAGSVLGGTNTVLGTLTCGGGFSGPLLVEAGASMTWTGGTASGPLSIESGGVVSITGNVGLKSILTNAGTVTMTGTAYVTVYNNDTPSYDGGIYNLAGALWDIQTNASIYDAGYGYEFFNNAGALLKSGGVATSYIGVPFTNAGTVTNLSGTLNFDGGGVLAGAYDTVAGATIDFAEGSFSIGVPPVISGAGLCEFTGTTLTLTENVPPDLVLAGGSLDLGPAFQNSGGITNLTLSGGALTSTNTVTGTLILERGTLAGPLTIASGGAMNITGDVSLENLLTNAGTVTMTGTAYLTVLNDDTPYYDGGVYNLAGALWDIQTNAVIYDADFGYEFFNNAGALSKSGGVGIAYIDVPFTNAGTVSNLSGALNFSGGGVLAGVYDTAAGATIDFANGSFSMGVPPLISGAGLCEFTGATLTLAENVPPDLVLAGGSLDLGPAFQNSGGITNLTLSGSALTGTNTVTGTLILDRGILAGPLTIATGGTMNIAGGVSLENLLTNAGTVTMTGNPYLTVYNNGTYYLGGVYNLAGALWDIQTNATIYDGYYGDEFFDNAGALSKSGGLGTAYIEVPTTNTGTVNALAGTLSFYNTFTNVGGTLAFGVSGLSSFGQINISGNAALNGTASVTWLDGFTPAIGNSFALLDYISHSGTFASINFPTGYVGQGNYGSTVFSVLITSTGVATNVTHVVTVGTSPPGVAAVSGAGTYTNGQTAIINAPTSVTNPPDIFTFQYYTLNGSFAASNAVLSVVMSALQPPALQYVAVYNAQSINPVLINVTANYASPVPATTNFVLHFQFDRTMNTAVTPAVLLTNAAPGAVQPVVGTNGHWTSTSLLNDTYVPPAITFGPGMNGTVQVFVSGAQDPAGHVMALTNAINLTVNSTPPVVVISSPTNGASFTTTNSFTFAAGASSIYGIALLALYDNGTNLLASAAATNISFIVSGLAAGSYALTAVATDTTGLSATSAVAHVTINTPGTTLIDFEALNASAGPVSGVPLSAYLAGYGVSVTNVTTNTVLAVQNDTNILDGNLTVASSGENLLTQIGANGLVSYTLLFNPPYPSVSWTRTALLAGTGGVETPSWQATAYDANGAEIGSVGERQTGSSTNLPAKRFTLGGADIASITFAGNNSIGALANLPLDDLLLSTFAPGANISIALSAEGGTNYAAPGQITLTAAASETGGVISQIAFYEGENLLGTVTGATNATWGLTNVAAGTYTFTAVAGDGTYTRSSAPLNVNVAPTAGITVINFDALDATAGAVGGAPLSNYLAAFGVTADNLTLGTRVEAVNGNNLSGNAVAVPSSPPNLFTQVGLNQPVTFSLELGAPVGSFGFTRVALTAGPAGISHPAWTALAFNAAGTEVESVSEPLIFSFTNVPARTFQLTGPGITRVVFDSDSQQTASFSAVLLDDLVLDTNTAPSALSVTLQSPSNSTAPTNLTLSATVSDTLGTVSSVAFYSGPNLIGTAPGASPEIVWSNVLAGTYVLTAQVFDSTGYARISTPVTNTVQPGQGYSTLVTFDNGLNASTGPVTGATLSSYLSGYGLALSGVTAGTQVAVENQAVLAGGGFVAAASPPNLLTQIGGNGPASFTVQFSNWLASFTFTRPELLANPFVTHPAWQATAFDALGVPLAQAGEGITSSFTNVPAQTFTLQAAGAGIASVQFASQGSSLTTFAAALLDNFILTTSPTNLAPSVVLTNPLPGQIFTTPAVIQVAAQALAAKGDITNVSFFANGSPIGSTNSSPFLIEWTVSAVGPYALTAVATDSSGLSRTSPPVSIAVNPTPIEFGIITQPVGATVAAGGGVIFSVQTTGTNAMTYQWDQNGAPLPGQTQSALSLTGVNNASQGTYTVTVSSDGQSLTSAGAVLTVLDPPTIVTPPLSQAVNIGSNAILSVAIDGTPPVTYQWILNGTGISGATNSTFAITNAQPLSSGNYQVIAANAVGFAESPVAAVSVTIPGGQTQSAYYFSNRITFNPLVVPVFGNNTGANATPEAGAPLLMDGKPYGRAIWYTWHASFDGVVSLTTRGSSFDTLLAVYTGTNVADLTLVAADDDSGGFFTSLVTFNCLAGTNYQIEVAGFQGASGTVVLGLPAGTAYRVLNPSSGDALPVITQQPTNQLVPLGASATLSVTATSSSPLTYQWFFQNAPVAGAGSSNLLVANFQSGSVGNYYVLVANGVGSAQSALASLQIGGLPLPGAPADTTEDKFGDAVDLAQQEGGEMRSRPFDGGGDSGGFSVAQTFSTVGATKEVGEPDPCGQVGGASEWYLYTTPVAGTLSIDTSGSQFNTILGVYTNAGTVVTFSNLVELGCGYTTNYQQRQPSVNLVGVPAKTTCYIVVDGYNAASGVARLNIGLGAAPQILTQPQSAPVVPGGSATFSVAAVGTTNFSYQWRFDGVNIAGASNSSFTVSNAQAIAAGSYSVVVSNVVDAVTSAPAALTVQSSPFILVPPASQSVNLGKTADFSVSAGGIPPLSYQWYFSGVPIARASSSTLAVAATKFANEGNYTVVVGNSLGSVTSAPAFLTIAETTKPTLRVTSPANNFISTSSSVTLRGTAGDTLGVSSVQLLVNSNSLQTAAGTTSWSATVALAPGANHVKVQSYNLSDLASTPVNLTLIYIVTSPLTLQINGSGKIIGATNQAPLEIGKGYTLTATPAAHFLFSNWTGGNFAVIGTNHVLSFVMSSNLFLAANFVANPFPAVAGAYNGLFYPASGVVTEQSSGFITLTLAPTLGTYTADISLAGGRYPFTGGFDLAGTSQTSFTGPSRELVTVALTNNLNPPDSQITGLVSASGWQSELTAYRAVFNGATAKATNYAARYTALLPPGPGEPQTSPGGYGIINITNSVAGMATLVGSVGDGASFSQAVPISTNGVIPVYASLYNNQGSLQGWITFTNEPPQTLSGTLTWIKLSGASKTLYAGGFTNFPAVLGSFYLPPVADGSELNVSNATLTIGDGDLANTLVYTNISVAKGKLTVGPGNPTNELSATFTAGTGMMTLTFRPTGSKAKVTAQGVVLQSSGTNAAGWFLGTNQSGAFLLDSQ